MKNTNKIVLSKIYRDYLNELEDLERDSYILKLEEDVDVDKDMIYATSLLHDLGRVLEIKEGINHAIGSVDIAREILEITDFSLEEKNRILSCISYHRTKDAVEDEFFNIFYRADKLSRPCFRCPAYDACNWSYEKKNHKIKY